MLQLISPLKGFPIEATDGRMGTVIDFLFDDRSWKVRWLVVECGNWMKERRVLIHPSALTYSGFKDDRFEVKLTMAQVEGGPTLWEHQPVSQQMQTRFYDYYGWESAWGGAYVGWAPGAMASPISEAPFLGAQPSSNSRAETEAVEGGDPNLRSVVEVIGYHIHARDGDIGHVENFMLDKDDWRLGYLVVDTKNWLPGRRVMIAVEAVTSVEWTDRHIRLDITRDQVRTSPLWNPLASFSELEKTHLDKHYGWMGQAG